MNILRAMSAAVLACSLIAAPPCALAQEAAPPGPRAPAQAGTVTATATARVMRTPDYLDVLIGVEVISETAQGAQAKCATTMEATLNALKGLGLDKYEPQTGSVTLSPRYTDQYRTPDERKIVGYTAVNTVRVRTADLKASARIIDAALKAGANRVDGVFFGVREYLEAREEALALAAKAARRKAEVLADALDQRLDRIVTLSESSPRWYGGSNRMAQVQMEANVAEPAPGEESVVPGQIEVTVDVTVTFEVRAK